MKALFISLFFLSIALTNRAQNVEFYIKNNCFSDSIKIILSKKEARNKNVEEIKTEKTFQEIQKSLLTAIKDSNNNDFLNYLEASKCYFSANFRQIESNKRKRAFLQRWISIKQDIKGHVNYKNEEVRAKIIYFVETTGIKEVDNLFLARKAALNYIDFWKKRSNKISGRSVFFTKNEDKVFEELSLGMIMLINIYKISPNFNLAINDFEYIIDLKLNLVPEKLRNATSREWKRIIAKETGIYLQ